MRTCANIVELAKCCKIHIYLQNLVSIQPRTSMPKIWQTFAKFSLILENDANLQPVQPFCPLPLGTAESLEWHRGWISSSRPCCSHSSAFPSTSYYHLQKMNCADFKPIYSQTCGHFLLWRNIHKIYQIFSENDQN